MSINSIWHASFNWATPVKAWRSQYFSCSTCFSLRLQLGHAGEGVEMAGLHERCSSDGALQLGHAGEGVEIGKLYRHEHIPEGLQLGHAGEGVEMASTYSVPSMSRPLQLGHAGEGVEMISARLMKR